MPHPKARPQPEALPAVACGLITRLPSLLIVDGLAASHGAVAQVGPAKHVLLAGGWVSLDLLGLGVGERAAVGLMQGEAAFGCAMPCCGT